LAPPRFRELLLSQDRTKNRQSLLYGLPPLLPQPLAIQPEVPYRNLRVHIGSSRPDPPVPVEHEPRRSIPLILPHVSAALRPLVRLGQVAPLARKKIIQHHKRRQREQRLWQEMLH